jgi:acetyl esterase/lipase
VICPGGAYLRISEREAEPIARRFASYGFRPFVLRYSIGPRFPTQMLELGGAIAALRRDADLHMVDSRFIALCGFSAGGHLASCYAVSWQTAGWAETLGVPLAALRPDAVVLGYPVVDLALLVPGLTAVGDRVVELPAAMLDQVIGPDRTPEGVAAFSSDGRATQSAPPMFLWHTADDALVPTENSRRLAAALAAHGVAHELHIFPGSVHGLALADESTEEGGRFLNPAASRWPALAAAFLDRQRVALADF